MSSENPEILDYAAHKPDTYFDGARKDFVGALRTGPDASILEVGCSRGGTGAYALDQGKCGRYVGIDITAEAIDIARERLTEVHVGNCETMELPWEPETFDALIMSEVLEHMIDPWQTLGRLAPLLKPGAQVMASSPNVSHIKVLRMLLRGRFDLADMGTMDRTHMRWFTPATYGEMIEGAGFELEKVYPLKLSWRAKTINALTGSLFTHIFWYQIGVHAVKPTATHS